MSSLISATICGCDFPRANAISFKLSQKGFSRLMLVLRPETSIERLTIVDFI